MCGSLFIQRDEFFIIFSLFLHFFSTKFMNVLAPVCLQLSFESLKCKNELLFEHFWGNQMQLNRMNAMDIMKIIKFCFSSFHFLPLFNSKVHILSGRESHENVLFYFHFILMLNRNGEFLFSYNFILLTQAIIFIWILIDPTLYCK